MPSPVPFRSHSEPNFHLSWWLGLYDVDTPGVEGANPASVRLDPANEVQLDSLLFIHPARGGQARPSSDDFIEGASELVADSA